MRRLGVPNKYSTGQQDTINLKPREREHNIKLNDNKRHHFKQLLSKVKTVLCYFTSKGDF